MKRKQKNTEARKEFSLTRWDVIMMRKNNIQEVAKLINNLIDGLVIEYLGYY